MSELLIAATTIFCSCSGVFAAGLYVPGESGEVVHRDGKIAALSFDQLRLKLNDLRSIAMDLPVPSEMRKQVLAQREDLQRRRSRLNAEELNVLGGCNYRLNDLDAAYEAWLEATRRDSRSFQAHS